MKTVLLLTSNFKEQDSVTLITQNIITAYQKISSIHCEVSSIDDLSIAEINKYEFLVVVHPFCVVSEKFKFLIESLHPKKTSIVFYIFGDYVRKSAYYIKLNDSLIEKKVLFYAASTAYSKLIKKTLINSDACKIAPFPVKTAFFNFQEKRRKEFRKANKLTNKDFALLYTGRISPQKNILSLISAYKKVRGEVSKQKNLKLFIMGNVDDFETPTFYEKKYQPGEYFQLLHRAIKDDSDIKVLPRINHSMLRNAYQGCDLFVSCSTYHDEDFGYSPIESICSGTPAVLTNWGGYRDLRHFKDFVKFIDVKFRKTTLSFSHKTLEIQLEKSLATNRLEATNLKNFKKKFSIDSISKSYLKNLSEEFETFKGFDNQFVALSLMMLQNNTSAVHAYENYYHSFWGDDT